MIVKALFWGQIFKIEILKDLYVLRSPESKNHVFRGLTKCESVINEIRKQKVAGCSNLEF